MAKNLLSDIVENNRDGSEVVEAVMLQKTEDPSSNLRFISVLQQQPFLKKIVKKLAAKTQDPKDSYILANLEKLREILLKDLSRSFCQVSTSMGDDGQGRLRFFQSHWSERHQLFGKTRQAARTSSRPQRKKTKSSGADHAENLLPWPAKRVPYVPPKKEVAVCVSVEGLDVSYLSQVVPCDVIRTDDYYPVLVLAEILSRTEGPLYTAIRGQGFAYGAYISIFKWFGQMGFTVREASSPDKALECLYDILGSLPQKAETLLSDFEIETAKAAVTFRLYSQRSTAAQVISKNLETVLLGFETLEQEHQAREKMSHVTRADLLRVYQKYFTKFLDSTSSRVTVMTTGPKNVKKYVRSFGAEPLGIKMETKTVKQLSAGK